MRIAILSPDWISNECIVAVYDSHQRDFYHFNRAYSFYWFFFNWMMKQTFLGKGVVFIKHQVFLYNGFYVTFIGGERKPGVISY